MELSAPARAALLRLKADFGMSFTHAVERAVLRFADSNPFEPMPDADRASLGLKPAGASRPNSKRGTRNAERGNGGAL